MTDVAANGPAGNPLNNLADRLNALVPPPAQPVAGRSAAVEAALRKSRARVAVATRRADRRSFVSKMIENTVRGVAVVPYALVALALRLVIARVFFLAGQTMIEGPRVVLTPPVSVSSYLPHFLSFEWSFIVPTGVKAETFAMFANQFSAVPVPPVIGAYLVSFAQFLLPVLLVLGLATRFSAFGLLVITMMIQLFVYPDALWTTHIYWIVILTALMSAGPGTLSLDHLIRWATRR